MSSSFFGLNIAQRALNAQNLAMLTVGHNIANANTEGFSRQRVTISASQPYPYPSRTSGWGLGQIGTGADAQIIERVKDEYLDRQVRVQTGISGKWNVLKDALEQIETIYNEPSETGFTSVFNAFWDSWQELSVNPESVSVRALVRERAANLTTAFKTTASQLEDYQASLNEEIKIKVGDVNSYATQIADLNSQIANVTAMGEQPNDLLDKRDLLLDKLSDLINFNVATGPNNQVNVFLAGRALVRENRSYSIVTTAEQTPTSLNKTTKLVSLKWGEDLSDVAFFEGKLKGLFEARDDTVVDYYSRLDDIAEELYNNVNQQHQSGFDLYGAAGGQYFTVPPPASMISYAHDIAVSSGILSDSNTIAAASAAANAPGDGSNALAIALLRRITTHLGSPLDGGTYEDYFNGTIARLGAESQEAIRMSSNQELLLGQLKQHQESVSGVSIDEEMANMVKFQHAYEAAARFMTAYDELLDRLINGVGIVGR